MKTTILVSALQFFLYKTGSLFAVFTALFLTIMCELKYHKEYIKLIHTHTHTRKIIEFT